MTDQLMAYLSAHPAAWWFVAGCLAGWTAARRTMRYMMGGTWR